MFNSDLGIKIASIKKKGKVTILNDKYVLKDVKRKLTFFEYLETRNFNYFPKMYTTSSDIEIMDYILDKEIPGEQRLEDLVYLTSILHLNTSFDKVIDIDNLKEIYETTIDKLTDLANYYLKLQDNIEEEIYMSPANYLLIRNISLIHKAINESRRYIEAWYKEVEKTKSIRYTYNHGNLRKSHLLESDNLYLISWDKSRIDFPVKDLEIFYRNSYLDINLTDMLAIYERKYPLKKEEKNLLYANLLIPDIITSNDEYLKIKEVANIILYLESIFLYLENDSEETNNDTSKQY